MSSDNISPFPNREQAKKLTAAELKALAQAELKKGAPPAAPSEKTGDEIGLKLICCHDLVDKEQGWIVDQFLPDDSLVVVAGPAGRGKTTACLSWAADITRGRRPVVGGDCEPRAVLMLGNEDSATHTKRLFNRLGGNDRTFHVEDEDPDLPWHLGDLPALAARIKQHEPAMVIIDTLASHVPPKVDLNKQADLTPLLVGLRRLATSNACAIVLICHTGKAQPADLAARVLGSIAIVATARHAILVASHPDEPATRVAAVIKSNLKHGPDLSYAFQLDPFRWLGHSGVTESDLVRIPSAEEQPDAVEMFLRSQLANGPKSAKEIEVLAEKMGISRGKLYRAKTRLRIDAVRRPGFQQGSSWSLPDRQLKLPEAPSGTSGMNDTNGTNGTGEIY